MEQEATVQVKKGWFSRWWEKNTGKPMTKRQRVVLIILAVIFLFIFYIVLDANKYRALVHVVEGRGQVGVNPTTLALDFGDLSRGTSAVRRVTVENGTPMPMFVMIWKTGGIAELMDIDRNYFKVAPNTSARIEFTTAMPASVEPGSDYTGRVYLFKIPTFGL